MIIYGKGIRHKYIIRLFRIVLICILCLIPFLFLGCSKVEFDPKTWTIKKVFSTHKK